MGKWGLHQFYSRDHSLRNYLPGTSVFGKSTLQSFLSKYKSVYIKPDGEHMGKGIIKVWKASEGYDLVKVRGKKSNVASINELYGKIQRETGRKRHVIQQTIDLAQINGHSFDIRVMMMRSSKGNWEYMGMLAKVAGPGSVITNVLRGKGYAVTVDSALAGSLHAKPDRIARIKKDLTLLSYKICKRFDRYKYSSKIGIDFAIDSSSRIWIIEVNFDFPSTALFNQLKDKTMYRKIRIRNDLLRKIRQERLRKRVS